MTLNVAARIAASVALAGAVVLPAGVSWANHDPTHGELSVNVTAPGAGVSGVVDVEVKITESFPPPRGIVEYWVEMHDDDGLLGTFCHEVYRDAEGNEAPVDAALTLRFRWDTKRWPSSGSGATNCDGGNPTLPSGGGALPNGPFEIYAKARMSHGDVFGPVVDDDTRAVGVSNSPSAPSGVRLAYDRPADRITVSWKANSEPDVDAYRVEECKVPRSSRPCESSDWKRIGDVAGTATSVTRTQVGIFRYRVAALRPDATGKTMVSPFAVPGGDPTEIEVDREAASSPPKSSGGDDSSGDSGFVGSSGGDSGGGSSGGSNEPETRTVVRNTRRVQRAAPQVLQRIVEDDPGFDESLPFDGALGGRPLDGAGEGEGQRAVLIPLAGGTVLLVFALQMHYLNRRASRTLEAVPVEDLGI